MQCGTYHIIMTYMFKTLMKSETVILLQLIGNVIGAAVSLKLALINYVKGLVKGLLDERSIEDIVGLLDRKDLEKYTEIASRAFELYSDMNKSNTSE